MFFGKALHNLKIKKNRAVSLTIYTFGLTKKFFNMFTNFANVFKYRIIYDTATDLFVNDLYTTSTSILSRIFSYISRSKTSHTASKCLNAATLNCLCECRSFQFFDSIHYDQ